MLAFITYDEELCCDFGILGAFVSVDVFTTVASSLSMAKILFGRSMAADTTTGLCFAAESVVCLSRSLNDRYLMCIPIM